MVFLQFESYLGAAGIPDFEHRLSMRIFLQNGN